MKRFVKQQKFAAGMLLGLAMLASAQNANAYPVGQQPQVLLTKSSNLPAGASVKVKATNLGNGCVATFYLNTSNSSQGGQQIGQAMTNPNHETESVSFAAPEAQGSYYVVLVASYCSNPADNGKVSTLLSVGGRYASKTTLWSNPLKASKNPTFHASARVSFAGKGIAGIPAKIVVTNPRGKVVFTALVKSTASGRVIAHFHPKNPVPGKYSLVVSFNPTGDFTGLVSRDTTVLFK